MDWDKKELFKEFVRNNPFLISYVKKGDKTWQDLYEFYDIYGEEESAWSKFLDDNKDEVSSNNTKPIDEIIKMAKNIDVDKVQEGITSLQKTLGLFGELFVGKSNHGESGNTREYNPRPLYRRFED